MITMLSAIFVFATVVLVHEAGHFVTAKMTGMKVEEFAVGFGPKVCSFKKGDTIYSLRLFPLGGYNKIAGMTFSEAEGDPRAFCARPIPARLLVIIAGALGNGLFAFFVFFFTFWGYGIQTFPNIPQVGGIISGSPAEKAGLQTGDRIISINGQLTEKWEDIGEKISSLGKTVVMVDVRRDGAVQTFTVIPEDNENGRATVGIYPYTEHHDVSWDEAFSLSAERCRYIMKSVFFGISDLVRGQTEGLSGPIGVARMAGSVAENSWMALLLFSAVLSLNLGVLNLLPVPLLDGGLLVLTLLEAVRGRALPEQALYYIQAVGMMILGGLFLYASAQDILSLMR